MNGGGVGATVANRRIAATSSAALPKSPYLTPMIWGPSYVVAIEPVRDEQNMRQPEEIAIWEAGPLAVSRHWFATIQPGDDAAIAAVLASLAELADMGTRHPDRRRGRALPKALAAPARRVLGRALAPHRRTVPPQPLVSVLRAPGWRLSQ